MTRVEEKQTGLTAAQEERQFALAKLDYTHLAGQEQALMDKRSEIWPKFFAILAIPGGYAGVVELKGAIFLLVLVPFFITCIALDVKHDEQVLRYDVRKRRKTLAAQWGFANHDSQYSNQDSTPRWWQGFYKIGKAAAFVVAEIIVSGLVSWYFSTTGLPALGVALAILNLFFTIATCWCML